MMIKRINKIKNFGVFKDFKWDATRFQILKSITYFMAGIIPKLKKQN